MTPAVRRLLKIAPTPVVEPLPPAIPSRHAQREIAWLRDAEAFHVKSMRGADRLENIINQARFAR